METIRVLVVDDEDSIRKRCVQLLARRGYEVVGAADARTALGLVRSRTFDLVLADIRMPGLDGIELLRRVKQYDPSLEVVMMTGYAAVDTAVKAMKLGASDYLTKPFDVGELSGVVEGVARARAAERVLARSQGRAGKPVASPPLLEALPGLQRVFRFVRKLAAAECNVVICGESGVGKDGVARAIHNYSPRRGQPFVVVDCAALSGSVLESELFGHVKGAFTGAHADRQGYFETAQGGTLFLDEIGEMPQDLQGKLLRVLQERVVVKVGSTRPHRIDVRILAATNRDLEAMVARGAFRRDLFYRLNVAQVTVPPLRHRREDIPPLVEHFLAYYAAEQGLAGPPGLGARVLEALVAHDWPGNVRELENAVHRAVVLSDGGVLSVEDLLQGGACVVHGGAQGTGSPSGFRDLRRRVAGEFTVRYL